MLIVNVSNALDFSNNNNKKKKQLILHIQCYHVRLKNPNFVQF